MLIADQLSLLKENKELWDLYAGSGLTTVGDETEDFVEPRVSRFFKEKGLTVRYPEDKKFAVCLTHDVDEAYPPLSHRLLSMMYSIRAGDYPGFKEQLPGAKKKSPYRDFKKIMAMEDEFDARSSFYFICTDEDPRRFRYDIEDLSEDLGEIVDAGCEVGLHGGYYSYDNADKIKSEKARLEKTLGRSVIGYRGHYLNLKVPDTWEHLHAAGFKYDSTLGLRETIGFRNGVCHPFYPYNARTGRTLDILEIPMAIMDAAIFDRSRPFSTAWELSRRAIDMAEQYNGVITLLWHSEIFGAPYMKDWAKLYYKILGYVKDKDAWITSGEEVYRWWEKNDR